MNSMVRIVGAAASVAMLALAPAAVASGGRPAGPAAGGGGTGVVAPTGGGGGGGGSASSGGIKDIPPAPVVLPPPPPPPGPPCATFTSATAPVGYYLSWAAVWNDFTIRSCSGSTQIYSVHVTDTDVATGLVGYDVTTSYVVGPNQSVSGIVDNDFAPFSTTYSITMTVLDSSGNALDSSALAATTLPAR
jgi:hypothetical protein